MMLKPTFATELKAFFQARKRNYFQWFLSFCTQMEKFSYGFQVGSREPPSHSREDKVTHSLVLLGK